MIEPIVVVVGAVAFFTIASRRKAKAEAEKRESKAIAERQRLQKEADIERKKQWEKDAPKREAQEATRREEVKITRELRYPEYLYCDECGKITKQCQEYFHNYPNRCMACNGGEYYENTCYWCDGGGD